MKHARFGRLMGVALLATAGCKKGEEASDGASPHASPAEGGDGGSTRSAGRTSGTKKDPKPDAPPLLPDVPMAALGARAGHVPGGLLYLSLRAAPTQAWCKTLPWPSEAEREAAEAARDIGFDPLAGDWLEHFSVPEDAVVSMTLLRPIDDGLDAVEASMRGFATGGDEDYEIAAIVPPRPREEIPSPPAGSGPSEAVKTAIRRDGAAAGYHSRIHVPSRDPAKTSAAISAMFDGADRTKGTEICRGLPGALSCVAEGGGVIMLRDETAAVVVDLVFFMLSSPEDPSITWAPTLKTALAVEPAAIPHAAALGGDAAAWLDPQPLARLHAMDRLERAIDAGSWVDDWPREAGDQLSRIDRFAELAEAPRLFPGVQLEATAQGKDLHARATWPVAGPLWGRLGASMIAAPASPSEVPKIAALCDSAVLCFRTQGIPDMRAMGKTLATKGFGGDFEKVMRRIERDEDYTFSLLLGGAWANLLAAGAAFPDSMSGAEAGVARSARDAAMRAEGFGGSVRSFSVSGFFRFESDYVFYARAKGSDVGVAQGLLALSGEPTREIELSGSQGPTTVMDTRASAPRAQVFLQSAQDEGGAGWLALADAPDRFSWLLGLPVEVSEAPAAYLEFPDLLTLVLSFGGGGDRTVEDMRGWLRGRKLRFVIDLADGAPRMRAALTGPP